MNNQQGWKIVKQDERYVVSDNDTLKKLITSTTELNPHHSTTGHSHAGQEEVYIFRTGEGEMEINKISAVTSRRLPRSLSSRRTSARRWSQC